MPTMRSPKDRRPSKAASKRRSKPEQRTPRFAKTYQELGRIVGMTRQHLCVLGREAAAPPRRADGRLEVSPWMRFLARRKAAGPGRKERHHEARGRLLRARLAKLRNRLARLRDSHLPAGEVRAAHERMVAEVRRELSTVPKAAAPKAVAGTAPEAEITIRDAIDEAMLRIAEGGRGDSAEPPEQPADAESPEERNDMPDRAALEAAILLARAELLEAENDCEAGELLPIDEVRADFGRRIGECRMALYSIPGSLAPQVVGLTVPEAKKRIRFAVEDAFSLLNER